MYKKRNESTKTFLDVDYTSELEKNQIRMVRMKQNIKLDKWFEKNEKELLVGLCINDIEKEKKKKKFNKWLIIIVILNLLLNLIQMILTIK